MVEAVLRPLAPAGARGVHHRVRRSRQARDLDGAQLANAFSTQLGWIQTVSAVFTGIGNFCETLYRSIPPLWLYGGVAFIGVMYAALFGLGATAYRLLYANR